MLGRKPKKCPPETLDQLIQFIQIAKEENIDADDLLQRFVEEQGEVSDEVKAVLAAEKREMASSAAVGSSVPVH